MTTNGQIPPREVPERQDSDCDALKERIVELQYDLEVATYLSKLIHKAATGMEHQINNRKKRIAELEQDKLILEECLAEEHRSKKEWQMRFNVAIRQWKELEAHLQEPSIPQPTPEHRNPKKDAP